MGDKNILCTECGQLREKLKAGIVPMRKDYPLFQDQNTKDWLSICRQVEDWLRKEMATADRWLPDPVTLSVQFGGVKTRGGVSIMEYPVRYKLILEYAPASPNFRQQVVLREDVIAKAKTKKAKTKKAKTKKAKTKDDDNFFQIVVNR